MELQTQFDTQQAVYAVRFESHQVRVTCSFCAGTGRVQGQNGSDTSCPKCVCGEGANWEYTPKQWYAGGPFTVGRVTVEVTDSPGAPCEIDADNYREQKGRKEEYMLAEFGIGCGLVFQAENLFADMLSAEAEAAKRNRDRKDD